MVELADVKSLRDDSGMTTVAYMLSTALSMIVLTWFCTFVVLSYSRAAIRGASERATRAGVIQHSVSEDLNLSIQKCEEVFAQDIESALSAQMRSGLSFQCSISNGQIRARTTGNFSSLSTFIPSTDFNESTIRTLEQKP